MNTKKINLAVISCLLLVNSFQVSGSESRQPKQSSLMNKISKISSAAMVTVTIMLTTTPLVEAYDPNNYAKEDYRHFADRFLSAFQGCYGDHKAGRTHEECVNQLGGNFEYRHIVGPIQNFQQELLQKIPAPVYACQQDKGLFKAVLNGFELKYCRGGKFWSSEDVAKQCARDHLQTQRDCIMDVVSKIAPEIIKNHQP